MALWKKRLNGTLRVAIQKTKVVTQCCICVTFFSNSKPPVGQISAEHFGASTCARIQLNPLVLRSFKPRIHRPRDRFHHTEAAGIRHLVSFDLRIWYPSKSR